MRVFVALALSLLSVLLAGASELHLRDPLRYPNMLSAPLGKVYMRGKADYSQRSSCRACPAQPCLPRCHFGVDALQSSLKRNYISAGYNPMQSGALRQGRIPRRYIVRMKKQGKNLDTAVMK